MLTQPQQPMMTGNDPLVMQHMTGGQMGLLPQAQFLTPSQYGAFRTMPGPAQHGYHHQDPGFFQNMLVNNQGRINLFGLQIGPKYLFDTYNPAVNPQMQAALASRRSDDKMLSLGLAGVGLGASALAGMAIGGPLGLVAGLGMDAAVDALGKPIINRIRETRAIQNMTMSKIAGGADVNAATGMGFNATSARSIDSFIRTQSSGDALFKEGDWRDLLRMGVEHGMFDHAQNANQYKDVLKKLRGSMTTLMEVVGSTDFRDIFKEFKRMQSMGASVAQYDRIARQENMYSRITGMSHSDLVSTYGQAGAMSFASRGLNAYQGSTQAMHNAAVVTMGQRMGVLSEAALARNGGVSGMAQKMTDVDANIQSRVRDLILPALMNDSLDGINENVNLAEVFGDERALTSLMAKSGSKVNSAEKFMTYQRNAGEAWGKLNDKYGVEMVNALMANAIGRQSGMTGVRATEFGYTVLGADADTAALKARSVHSDDFREHIIREEALARRKRREEEDHANSFFRHLTKGFDKLLTKMGEKTFGRFSDWYTNWQQKNENAKAGVVSVNQTLNGANMRAALNSAAGGGGGKARISFDTSDTGWNGVTNENAEMFYAKMSGMIGSEAGSEGMAKTSMLVKKNADGTYSKGGGWFKDAGGASFGAFQFNTHNMIKFFTNPDKKGGLDERKAVMKKHGIDWDNKETANRLQRIRAEIEANGKNANISQEDMGFLYNMQQAWKELATSDSTKNQFLTDYINESLSKTWFPFLNNAKNGKHKNTNEILQTMLKDEGWRRTLYSMSNHMGGGGAYWALNKTFELGGITKEEVERALADPAANEALLTKVYTHLSPVTSGKYGFFTKEGFTSTAPARYSPNGAELKHMKYEHALLRDPKKQAEYNENWRKNEAKQETARTDLSRAADNLQKDISEAGRKDDRWYLPEKFLGWRFKRDFKLGMFLHSALGSDVSEENVSTGLSDLEKRLGLKSGSTSNDVAAFNAASARQFSEVNSFENLADIEKKTEEVLTSFYRSKLGNKANTSEMKKKIKSLAKDENVQKFVISSRFMGAKDENPDEATRLRESVRLTLIEPAAERRYQQEIAVYNEHAGKLKESIHNLYSYFDDDASTEKKEDITNMTMQSVSYALVPQLAKMLRMRSHFLENGGRTDRLDASIRDIAGRLGIKNDSAIQKMMDTGRITSDLITVGPKTDQKIIDRLSSYGRAYVDSHIEEIDKDPGRFTEEFRTFDETYRNSQGVLTNAAVMGQLSGQMFSRNELATEYFKGNVLDFDKAIRTPEGLAALEERIRAKKNPKHIEWLEELKKKAKSGDLGLDSLPVLPHYRGGVHSSTEAIDAPSNGPQEAALKHLHGQKDGKVEKKQEGTNLPDSLNFTLGKLDGTLGSVSGALDRLTAAMNSRKL